MISAINLYKLLIGNSFPKCVNCVHFKPGVTSDGLCRLFREILEARINSTKCGIHGKEFKENKK